ncbi:9300_t:CDS:2, partial [Entrophospora sp. SA101]
WKSTNIYPIPKPKEWECQLNNTHPITLLDTTRKASVHLLNNCIAKIFLNNRILKGNQFAGLPGTSTFEPIHIINEIIQDAREMKNEIWILFQDLSKAYDHMLVKAMEHLKLPSTFINLIFNIFTNRKNRIFTEVGLTNEYNVLIGIDQGEVMSPLLWCIYYNSLLCEIESRGLGYNLKHSHCQNIYIKDYNLDSICISNIGFMDDITWITEEILTITDDFYNLNSIKVNKDKSALLKHQPDFDDDNNSVQLQFGLETINIQPNNYKESAHILGVWVNLDADRRFVIQQQFNFREQLLHFQKLIIFKEFPLIHDFVRHCIWSIIVHQQHLEGMVNRFDIRTHPNMCDSRLQLSGPTSFNHVITAEKLTVTQAKRREKASLSIDPVISEEEAIRLTEEFLIPKNESNC